MIIRPPAIIRTLPVFYADMDHPAGRAHKRLLKRMETNPDLELHLALSQRPRARVEHIYILTANRIRVRVKLTRFEDGDKRECFDGSMRTPTAWAICTGPISLPPRDIIRRGFQGIRYTEELW